MSLTVDGIGYKYRSDGAEILKDIRFALDDGQIGCIVGPTGCGKTTLGLILSGVIPDLISTGELSGTFSIDGVEEGGCSVAVVSQSPENQLFGYGVEDAIVFGLENRGLPFEVIDERLEFVLDMLNIQHLRHRSVSTLSGGQRQAVCIASVLALEPKVLIMDEPVSSLDPNGKQLVQSILRQLKQTGQTTLIIDNNLDWCADIVEKVIGIDGGAIVFDGTKQAFFEDFDLQLQLGVTIPQSVEIYRELAGRMDQLSMFYTVGGAEAELSRFLPADGAEPKQPVPQEGSAPSYLDVVNVEKYFEDFHALKGLSAKFPQGKVISIIGQNGSGKTTLVKHLNGLYHPTSGEVLFLGQSIAGKSVAEISRDIILVFQHPEHMIFEETVYKELIFCANAQGISFSEDEANQVLAQYGLAEYAEEFPVNLAMGQKHILTILSVLFSSAQVVIFDEPTLGMDAKLKARLEEIIADLRSRGKTIIMISHETPFVFKMSDEILLMDTGREIFYGAKEEFISNYGLLEEYNITVPPVITLCRKFGLDPAIVTPAAFAQAFSQRCQAQPGGAE